MPSSLQHAARSKANGTVSLPSPQSMAAAAAAPHSRERPNSYSKEEP